LRPLDDDFSPEAVEWQAARIGGSFVVDSAIALSDAFEGELVRGLVFLTIVRLNIGGLGEDDAEKTVNAEGRSPTPLRLPTSAYAVAKALGLNYETVRRHIGRLVETGFCLKADEGYVAPAEVAQRPEIARFVRRMNMRLRRLNRHLAAAGMQSY
jgi:hypothetical protein